MIRRFPARSALLISLVVLLAACGSDRSQTEGGRAALGAAKTIAAKMRAGRAPAQTPDPEQMAAAAKASFDGPLILAQIENTGLMTVLGEYGRNGSVRTYSTPNKQTLSFRDGVLIASRGLGFDLMSSDTGIAVALITGRRSGTSDRSYRYLDGEWRERPLPMTCTYQPGAARTLSFAGTSYATVQVEETCQAKGQSLTVTNSYWVTGNGTIALSRQWIGPALGHVTVQLVRP